ncbi:MAG: gliding motility-associated C-terminal domain-containing protein [Bacteroidota bacterium]
MKLKFSVLVLLGLMAVAFSRLEAQVVAPDFLCVVNDSLRWDNRTNSCGPYVATQIFVADNPDGPYSELASIPDAATTSFSHPNPNGELRYYYLQYTYNCPGTPVLTSDTLDNRIPTPPASTWVSVENNTVVVHWTPGASPQTSGYLIYRQEPTGLNIIGQVNGATTTTYVDNGFTGPPPLTTYRVTAIDACGNNSLFGPEVTTAELSLNGGQGCTADISLPLAAASASNPLPFFSWELFASVNGGPFTLASSFGGNAPSIVYDQANDGENICFYAEGTVQGQNGRPVRTPVRCVDVAIIQPVRPFNFFGAGFDAAGNLSYDFGWDNLAAVDILTLTTVDAMGVATNEAVDFSGLATPVAMAALNNTNLPATNFSLSLRADDACGNAIITNTVQPVFLSGSSTSSGTNTLVWTPFENEISSTITYQLLRTGQDGTTEAVYSGLMPTFEDRIDITDANLGITCYQVIASVEMPDGMIRTYASNRFCIEQAPMVYTPNVFSPVATMVENREFCPGFSRLPTGDYQLDIYDRWSGHRFSTKTPGECWDGTSRGEPAASGVYLYVLRFELAGRTVEKAGDITLIR